MYLKTRIIFHGYGDFEALTEHLAYLGFKQDDFFRAEEFSYARDDIVIRIELKSQGELGDFIQITIESQDATFDHPRHVYESVANVAVQLFPFLVNTPIRYQK